MTTSPNRVAYDYPNPNGCYDSIRGTSQEMTCRGVRGVILERKFQSRQAQAQQLKRKHGWPGGRTSQQDGQRVDTMSAQRQPREDEGHGGHGLRTYIATFVKVGQARQGIHHQGRLRMRGVV